MKSTRFELETTITMNAEEPTAEVFTADPATLRRLEKLRADYPDAYVQKYAGADSGGNVYERAYTIPKRLIRFGKPASAAKIAAGRAARQKQEGA